MKRQTLKKTLLYRISHISRFTFPFVIILFHLGCTDHPFGNNNISLRKNQISGKIVLNDNLPPEGIVVWLEGFKLQTNTDKEGSFKITLPSPLAQNAPGGVDGAFILYFYVANYLLGESRIAIRHGEFIYAQGDINKAGEVNYPRQLEKILHINTSLVTKTISAQSNQTFLGSVTLESINIPVTVSFPISLGGNRNPVILKNITSGEFFILQAISQSSSDELVIVKDRPYIRNFIFKPGQNVSLSPGNYEIIPVIRIWHQTIPDELLESLGTDDEDIVEDYLNIPFRRTGDILTVTN